MEHDDLTAPALAEKIRKLISLKLKPDGSAYNDREIADEVSALYRADQIASEEARLTAEGASQEEIDAAMTAVWNQSPLMHRTYVAKLKSGAQSNPTMNVLTYLSRFFGVSPAYLFPGEDTREAEEEVEALLRMRQLRELGNDQQVMALARGAGELTPKAARAILDMALVAVENARDVQQMASRGECFAPQRPTLPRLPQSPTVGSLGKLGTR